MPRFITFTRLSWNPQTNNMEQVEARVPVAGDYDEAKGHTDGNAMHPHLRRIGAKRSGTQPVEPQPAPSPENPEKIDKALDELDKGLAAQGERVEALREEAEATRPPPETPRPERYPPPRHGPTRR